MTESDLKRFKVWFSTFVRSYAVRDEEERKSFDLKEKHTSMVCDNVREVGREIGLNDGDLVLAEAIALLHDVGRFPQYSNYRTFRDSISVNHGQLGADTLQAEGVLDDLSPEEQQIVLDCVKFHNAYKIPESIYAEAVPFMQLIRDADKLDIWRVFVEFYSMSSEDRISVMSMGLPDVPRISPGIIDHIKQEKIVPLSMIRTLNDFRLMQLSWVYDINHTASLRLAVRRDYIRQIALTLPDEDDVSDVVRCLSDMLIRKVVCDEDENEVE